MNQRKAFKETMDLAYERGMHRLHLRPDLSFRHLEDMWRRVSREQMSESKLGRWLGWAQATVVASGVATLEEMKQINKRNATDAAGIVCNAFNPRTAWECSLYPGEHKIINGKTQHKTYILGEAYTWFVEA